MRRAVVLALAWLALVAGCDIPLRVETPMPTFTDHPAAAAPASPPPAPPARCTIENGKADRDCTPGVRNPNVTQANIAATICRRGWTATIRPPVSYTAPLERRAIEEYGLKLSPAEVEYDHLIPLGLGGDPRDQRNLYPQPYAGPGSAYTKDGDERALNRAVCAGRKKLADAQDEIVRKWTHA